MEVNQVKFYLGNFKQRESETQEIAEIKNFLKKTKENLVRQNKQEEAKEIWCLEQVLEIQDEFLKAYTEMKQNNFYEAWCILEQCEITSDSLRPHFCNHYDEYHLNFIDKQVRQYQSLFPYKLFISPEILELERKCNICGQIVSIRKLCGHEVGQIYNGEMCVREVTKLEFLGTAFVESPLQKYSVLFASDAETKERKDNYNYGLLKYLLSKLKSPFVEWEVSQTKKLYFHSKFNNLGRDDKCPCGSGKEYRNCCLTKPGVLLPHYAFKIPGIELREEGLL